MSGLIDLSGQPGAPGPGLPQAAPGQTERMAKTATGYPDRTRAAMGPKARPARWELMADKAVKGAHLPCKSPRCWAASRYG
jgi:hypothetical protein